MAVEFPGYGIYESPECNESMIKTDAEAVYSFLAQKMGFDQSKLLIIGRCIGSGPAVHLSSKFNPKALILISPFTSIKKAIKSILDKINVGFLSKIFVEMYIQL